MGHPAVLPECKVSHLHLAWIADQFDVCQIGRAEEHSSATGLVHGEVFTQASEQVVTFFFGDLYIAFFCVTDPKGIPLSPPLFFFFLFAFLR